MAELLSLTFEGLEARNSAGKPDMHKWSPGSDNASSTAPRDVIT